MATYNEFLPKLEYNGVLISDITHRLSMSNGIEKYRDNYYTTLIEHHNTPENVSQLLYGTSDHWWIICAINGVIDPFYDWVMLETEVYAYAEKLYADINDIHHWEDTEFNVFDSNNAQQTLEPITNIEWEIYNNDKKLRINTIKPKHILKVVKEMKQRMKLIKPQTQG